MGGAAVSVQPARTQLRSTLRAIREGRFRTIRDNTSMESPAEGAATDRRRLRGAKGVGGYVVGPVVTVGRPNQGAPEMLKITR